MKNKTKVITIITTVFLSVLILLSYVIKPPSAKADEVTYTYDGNQYIVGVWTGGSNGKTQSTFYELYNYFGTEYVNGTKYTKFRYMYKPTVNWSFEAERTFCNTISTQDANGNPYNQNGSMPLEYTLDSYSYNGNYDTPESSNGFFYLKNNETIVITQQLQSDIGGGKYFSLKYSISVNGDFNSNVQYVQISKKLEYLDFGKCASFMYYDNNGNTLEVCINTPLNLQLDRTRTYYINSEATNTYNDGYNAGLKANNTNAYNQGYSAGVEAGNSNQWINIFSAVIDVPINAFFGKYNAETGTRQGGLFNLEIFGYNMANVASAILTISIAIIVIRFVLARRG